MMATYPSNFLYYPAHLKIMPKYAVVICPACRNPFIIEPGTKTVSCRYCNKKHETKSLRVFLATDDFKEAQTMRGSINAHICGDPTFDEGVSCGAFDKDVAAEIEDERFTEDRRLVEEKMREEAKQTRTKGQQAILTDTFDELGAGGDVSIDEYWKSVCAQGITRKKFDAWIDKMLETGVAYSPRHGYLRKG